MSLYDSIRRQIDEAIKIQDRYENGSLPRETALRYLDELGVPNPVSFLDRTPWTPPIKPTPWWAFWR